MYQAEVRFALTALFKDCFTVETACSFSYGDENMKSSIKVSIQGEQHNRYCKINHKSTTDIDEFKG